MLFHCLVLSLFRLCQIDRRNAFSLCVMVSPRCASRTVRDIGNEQVGSVNHPIVPADNGVLRRYVFKRRIDNLVKKAVVFFDPFLKRNGQIRNYKTVSDILRFRLRVFYAMRRKIIESPVSAAVTDKRIRLPGMDKQLVCKAFFQNGISLKIAVAAKCYNHFSLCQIPYL